MRERKDETQVIKPIVSRGLNSKVHYFLFSYVKKNSVLSFRQGPGEAKFFYIIKSDDTCFFLRVKFLFLGEKKKGREMWY